MPVDPLAPLMCGQFVIDGAAVAAGVVVLAAVVVTLLDVAVDSFPAA
ncbi:MAG TPA: hypothetical protein VMU65_01365 [Candidatus Saccharimonadales bacterium]|nr:hypothetical protein [Candidatus Saccharimonadales bacterium]